MIHNTRISHAIIAFLVATIFLSGYCRDSSPSGRIESLYTEYRNLLKSDHRQAIRCLDEMLDIFKNEPFDGELQPWHGACFVARGDYAANESLDYREALDYYMTGFKLLASHEYDAINSKWLLMSRIQFILDRYKLYDEACEFGKILTDISTKNEISELTLGFVLNLADTYIKSGKTREAEEIVEKFGNELKECDSLKGRYWGVLGKIYLSKGNYRESTAALRKALSHEERISHRVSLQKYLLISTSHHNTKSCDSVADQINKTTLATTVNRLLKISPSKRHNWQDVCSEAIDFEIQALCNGANISKELLELSMFRKGLLLRTTESINALASQKSKSSPYNSLLKSLKDTVNQLLYHDRFDEMHRYQEKVDNVEWEMAHEVISDENVARMLTPTLEAVRKNLGKNDTAIEFVYNDWTYDTSKYIAIVFTKNTDPIAIDISCYRDSICVPDFVSLWSKLKPYMENRDNIWYCADGVLNGVPIEYLRDIDGVPMSQKYRLHRVFHLSDIKPSESIGNKLVAIGVSDHNSPFGQGETIYKGKMTDLPNVAYEMQLIRNHIDPDCLILMFNDNATENGFKRLDKSDITSLHISTHGIYRDNESLYKSAQNPEDEDHRMALRMLKAGKESLSCLILRQGNIFWQSDRIVEDNDDILTSEEIENMVFPNLRLTVISACDSGLGDTDAEGVWGLQRAFRIAGSKSLICSLMKIDDYWSVQFMDAFYQYAGKGNTIYDSFRYAQKELFDAVPDNPNIWASFILIE